MALESPAAVVKALAQCRSAEVIGTAESVSIDFKRCLYPLHTDKGKRDLCVDVAAMANAAARGPRLAVAASHSGMHDRDQLRANGGVVAHLPGADRHGERRNVPGPSGGARSRSSLLGQAESSITG
jgi:hypothetical protein